MLFWLLLSPMFRTFYHLLNYIYINPLPEPIYWEGWYLCSENVAINITKISPSEIYFIVLGIFLNLLVTLLAFLCWFNFYLGLS